MRDGLFGLKHFMRTRALVFSNYKFMLRKLKLTFNKKDDNDNDDNKK